jgi:Co/Zn/Cd efflux system component
MLTDVAGVGMALLAIWFAGRPATNGRTFAICGSRSSPP